MAPNGWPSRTSGTARCVNPPSPRVITTPPVRKASGTAAQEETGERQKEQLPFHVFASPRTNCQTGCGLWQRPSAMPSQSVSATATLMVRAYVSSTEFHATGSSSSARNSGDISTFPRSSFSALPGGAGELLSGCVDPSSGGGFSSLTIVAPLHANSFAMLRHGVVTHLLCTHIPRGSTAQYAGVVPQRQSAYRARIFREEDDSTLTNGKLTSIERMFTSARLDHGNAPVQCAIDFHEAHQQKIIHNRADRKIRHVGGDAEELGVFIVEESRHQAMLAKGHERVKEVAVHRQIANGIAITGHAIDHHPLYLEFLNQLDNAREM